MPWTQEEIDRNREYFAEKLHAIKQRNDVLHAVQGNSMDFVLLDTRAREAFAAGHIPGAWCAPFEELESVLPQLPKDRELVTYCWGHD
jgi:rhodanese-related sulfurtransferase